MVGHRPHQDVAGGVQVGATVVVDHPLGLAGGAGGVVERDRLPLVLGQPVGMGRVALGEQRLVLHLADGAPLGDELGIRHVDDQRLLLEFRHRRLDDVGELRVDQDRLRLAVFEHVGDRLGIQADVQCVEHTTGERHAEVGLEHRRHVGQHGRHRLAGLHAPPFQRRGEPPAALPGGAPVAAGGAVDHRRVVRVDRGGALDEGQRRERHEVGGGPGQALLEDALAHGKAP